MIKILIHNGTNFEIHFGGPADCVGLLGGKQGGGKYANDDRILMISISSPYFGLRKTKDDQEIKNLQKFFDNYASTPLIPQSDTPFIPPLRSGRRI